VKRKKAKVSGILLLWALGKALMIRPKGGKNSTGLGDPCRGSGRERGGKKRKKRGEGTNLYKKEKNV